MTPINEALRKAQERVLELIDERDAARAFERTAYARGVGDAADRLMTHCHDDMTRAEEATAIRALADAPPASVLRVRPLVWEEYDVANDWSDPPQSYPFLHVAEMSIGRYDIHRAVINETDVWSLRNPEYFPLADFDLGNDRSAALDAAKAAAQADYEARIRSALIGGE